MAPRQELSQKNRNKLSRRDLTTAAIALIEREGLDALSMRRLATELECAPMSLYTHVRSRDDLIDAVVEHLIEQLAPPEWSGESWQQVTRRTLEAYRDLAVQMPNSFELLALAPYDSSPVAPHLSRTVASFEQAGLTPEQARQILGILDGYATGFLIVWARSSTRGRSDEYAATAPGIAGLRDLEMFDRGLDALIAGLDLTLVRGTDGGEVLA
ncbi:TetR family transcriptional regulator [Microterricola gilva]|uniref:TetR family transcriptional regulator n=1 Tax=Microterricola gilva TaxID=393267 RepID=A0A4Q8AP39_9MICO|nr:TetR family transcriptional regulator [Microterricola gilva]RZU66442.1 TetR family transcriptional regulator [Microterricola gilva]